MLRTRMFFKMLTGRKVVMKTIEDRITTILDQAERSLQEVIAEAAKAGDYHKVDVARHYALETERLRKRRVRSVSPESGRAESPSIRDSSKIEQPVASVG